jgi:uncharacterized protein involved in tolerance to divalent cations
LDYDDANEYSNGLISHKSIFLDDDEESKNYTLYLPYLNELIELDKINIYELIDNGMIFIDENGMNITELINNNYKEINSLIIYCLNLRNKIDTNYWDVQLKLYEFDDNFPSTPEYERLNIQIIEKNEKIKEIRMCYFNDKIFELKQYLESEHEFKKIIQSLEYKYSKIIEPILSFIEESSRYDFANDPELSISKVKEKLQKYMNFINECDVEGIDIF